MLGVSGTMIVANRGFPRFTAIHMSRTSNSLPIAKAWTDKLPISISRGGRGDLILAGHSHGGQVRIPFYGPILLPYGVGRYDLGMFRTGCGPLYVNPGIGWFPVPIRFNCQPEITVFEI